MVVLELKDDEAKLLQMGLNRFLLEMEREIARTDSREFRLELKKTEEVMRNVVDELRRVA